MNRVGLGLAVGAGYVLGRTKKLKLAFAVGTLVAGKRMQLSPRALAELVSTQLRDNPQFKEIGDQLRVDLRGVGKAASGAMVERQVEALANRLHGRTAEVRDQLAGVLPGRSGRGRDEEDGEDGAYDEEASDQERDEEESKEQAPADRSGKSGRSARPAKKTAAKKTTATKKAATKKAEPRKATASGRPAARKTAAKKTAAARDAGRGTRSRLPKGGGDR
ncbi:DNA primase [Streptomyces sp. ME02-8801-2C]|uniref:DNA primase n=1 Tax=Streptomyces sp. ME02-8801-2C TaxID=3028680 RepID=UPI0029A59882|nr:DNA primase [Streptomyces sp. ME02-8801-2C]MDX3451361.1 DNA primase [Streptomyces sp. ME02-8801-2C]